MSGVINSTDVNNFDSIFDPFQISPVDQMPLEMLSILTPILNLIRLKTVQKDNPQP